MRERGLKHKLFALIFLHQYMSLPVRERGLKRTSPETMTAKALPVAPRAGAWIETMNQSSFSLSKNVAPRAGAWIETKSLG